MEIVIPKRYPSMDPHMFPVFLAGPVLGGGDWQTDLITAFHKEVRERDGAGDYLFKMIFPRLRFIVPCRWNEKHWDGMNRGFSDYLVKMYTLPEKDRKDIKQTQTYWEAMFLSRILKEKWGLIVFGLFPENENKPRKDGNPYARDTYGEVGRYLTMAAYEQAEDNVIVYGHPTFLGWDVQKKNIAIFNSEKLNIVEGGLRDLTSRMAEVIPELLEKKSVL